MKCLLESILAGNEDKRLITCGKCLLELILAGNGSRKSVRQDFDDYHASLFRSGRQIRRLSLFRSGSVGGRLVLRFRLAFNVAGSIRSFGSSRLHV